MFSKHAFLIVLFEGYHTYNGKHDRILTAQITVEAKKGGKKKMKMKMKTIFSRFTGVVTSKCSPDELRRHL